MTIQFGWMAFCMFSGSVRAPHDRWWKVKLIAFMIGRRRPLIGRTNERIEWTFSAFSVKTGRQIHCVNDNGIPATAILSTADRFVHGRRRFVEPHFRINADVSHWFSPKFYRPNSSKATQYAPSGAHNGRMKFRSSLANIISISFSISISLFILIQSKYRNRIEINKSSFYLYFQSVSLPCFLAWFACVRGCVCVWLYQCACVIISVFNSLRLWLSMSMT